MNYIHILIIYSCTLIINIKGIYMIIVGMIGLEAHIYVYIGPGPNLRTLNTSRTGKYFHKDPC